MKDFFKEILFVILILSCLSCLVACANKNKDIAFKDVLVENVSPVVSVSEEEPRSEIICDASTAQAKLESFGFSSDTISIYDDAYFEANDVAIQQDSVLHGGKI